MSFQGFITTSLKANAETPSVAQDKSHLTRSESLEPFRTRSGVAPLSANGPVHLEHPHLGSRCSTIAPEQFGRTWHPLEHRQKWLEEASECALDVWNFGAGYGGSGW